LSAEDIDRLERTLDLNPNRSFPSMPSAAPSPPQSAPGSRPIHRVAMVFAGGPAPAANAVISTAAASFLRHGIEVLGILHGYAHLMEYGDDHPMEEGRDYIVLDQPRLKRTRNTRGILIGTSRANPGKDVSNPAHLRDPEHTAMLRRVHRALDSLGVDALISIGGDDTLKTANKFQRFQQFLPADARRIAVVHVPKTIDNDYRGIDFTFGYFTAVEFLASEIRNLLADAEANRLYFLAEAMGRSAGWLAYGAYIAGEASKVFSVEDLDDGYLTEETITDPKTGKSITRQVMDADKLVGEFVHVMLAREKEGKEFGVIVVAEGLAEYLPSRYLEGAKFDDHGHISLPQTQLGKNLAGKVESEYQRRTGRRRRVTGLQLGYEARCALPHAFDVVLGSQLGVGAYRALVENGLDGVLISVAGQLNLNYVPFEDLVDPETLVTVVRRIQSGSDFQQLARFLENYPHD
jgi:6-phosphofructokinase 1